MSFKLTSIEMEGFANQTPHHPELVLNGFSTRLGGLVGRMFQTMFPPLPEFQGRQVVTLHNQRDFLFFRRHRYAFREEEKVKLQESGPRFTLKLREVRRGVPGVRDLGDSGKTEGEGAEKEDEWIWRWKKELGETRKTFFL